MPRRHGQRPPQRPDRGRRPARLTGGHARQLRLTVAAPNPNARAIERVLQCGASRAAVTPALQVVPLILRWIRNLSRVVVT